MPLLDYAEPLIGRPAWQSSTLDGGSATLAIDGNGDLNASLCTLTNYELEPWWTVDLGKPRRIFQVVLFNRAHETRK